MIPSTSLYKGAAVFASVTGIGAALVAVKLPIQHNKTGPFNYHRALKPVRRITTLANKFQHVYNTEGRLDFVFANAGIVERFNFYAKHSNGRPPPPPDQKVIDTNLKSVVDTLWLSQHYLRHSTIGDDRNIIVTASVGSLYPALAIPSYCAAKHGVLGLMRSVAPYFYRESGIRVNAICPGSVRTNLLDEATWDTIASDIFVPLEKISQTVLMLIDGYDVGGKAVGSGAPVDSGVTGGEKLYGKAVEISGTEHYYREPPMFCDERTKRNIKQGTDRESLS
ncbi:NAD(P)-binding -27 [Lecanosticta acicola]|uniref:NAD(P)-binding -27 n=1 Tax=Lecanosticta acicola TaxID=111012 RepID=A0AAI8Z3S3_9PEZI|nr:NAD(P)-binding -27 [Lecanosticta acicola]